jgi:large conductance mechanosensitive channel
LNTVPDFVLVAFAIFLLVRQIDKLHRKPEEAPAPPSTGECPFRGGAIPIQATRCPRRSSQLA